MPPKNVISCPKNALLPRKNIVEVLPWGLFREEGRLVHWLSATFGLGDQAQWKVHPGSLAPGHVDKR
jgi:hypothetical protein